jgi:hypothetical protein
MSSNSSAPTSTGSAIAGSGALQAPHLPASARRRAGIRFGFPQDGQFRRMAMANIRVLASWTVFRSSGDCDNCEASFRRSRFIGIALRAKATKWSNIESRPNLSLTFKLALSTV